MTYQDKTREQLIEEIEALEAAAGQNAPDDEWAQLLHDQDLLSKAAIELMNFPLDGDIYPFIGERLKELSNGRFVIVSTFDAQIEKVRVRAVAGLSKHGETVLNILGRNPVGMTLPLSEETKEGLFTNELERVESGLYGIAFKQIPKAICHTLEQALNLGHFYGMGFFREDDLFGSIVLVLDREAELKNPQAVKAFMGLAAVALQNRQAEAALLKSEARLREAERLARLGHYEIDLNTSEAIWSAEIFRIFGMTPEQEALTIENFQELIYEADRAPVQDHFRKCVEARTPFDLTYRIVTINGDIRHVHSLGRVEDDPETGEIKLFGVLQDVTAQKEAERKLERGKRLWDALMDNTPDLVYFKDNEHRMIQASQAYADVLGRELEDLIGKTALDLWHREGEEILADERKVLAGEPIIKKERQVTTPQGKSLWYLLTKIPIYDDEDIIGFFAIDKDITERKRIDEALRRRAEELTTLQATVLDITMEHDLSHLLEIIVERATRLLDALGGTLHMCDPERREVRCVLSYSTARDYTGTILRYGEGAAGKVAETGEALIINGYPTWNGRATAFEEDPLTAILSAPMTWQGKVIGVINVLHDATVKHFTEPDLELLSLFANHAAIAVKNTRLYEETERRATQARLAYEVGQQVSSELELDPLLSSIVSAVRDAFDYHNVVILLLDEGADRLTMQSIAGAYVDILPPDVSLAVGEGMIGHAAKTGETQFSNNIFTDPHYVRKGLEDTRSELAVPIKSGQKIIGVLDIQEDELDAFDEIDVSTVETLSTQIATAIETVRLFQAERERSTQLAAVSEIAESIAAMLDPHEVLHRATELITEAFGYYHASIMLLDPASDELAFEIAAGGFAGKTPPDFRQKVKEGMIGWAAYLGETLLASDVSKEPRYIPAYLPETRSELDVPLKHRDQVIGVLDLQSKELNAFNEHDVLAMEALAGHVATAIENARLFEETQRRALEQETLREAAMAMTTALKWDEVVERILAQLQAVAPYDTASVQLLRDDVLEIVGGRGLSNLEDLLGVTLDPNCEDTPNQQVIRDRTTFIVEDVAEMYAGFRCEPHVHADIRSWLGAPMVVGDRLIGMIALDKREPGFYTEEHARLTEAFAAQAAVAIENARLYEELRGYVDHLEERVTERTAQLRAHFAQLEAILDNTVNGIVLTGADGEFILINPIADRWLNRTLASDDAQLLQEQVQEIARQALDARSKPRRVLELTGLDLELSAAPIADPDAGQAKAVVAIHDVSRLKALDRMKSRFVTNVSHELRTPVTTIKLYAHLMKEQPENWREYLALLTQEAEHQAKLVEDILEISRVDAGRLALKPRPMDLNELVDILIKNHETMIREQELTLEHRTMETGTGPIALLDPQRIIQVLSNLTSNAIYYTPPGGRVTVVTGVTEAQGRKWATVTISDSGIGIPEEELPHIFERFFRGEEPQAMQISGTGMGLAIANEIVALHGGRITVESEVGVGSAFTVWLPLFPVEKNHA